jgi:hypothetical protein
MGEKTVLYMGGLFFVFLVAFILYRFLFLYIFVPLLVLSFLSNLLWLKVINDSKKETNKRDHIDKMEDRGTPYITYMTSYLSVLPLVYGGVYGLAAFAVILVVFFFMYLNSDIIYYNPFLAILGYKYSKATTARGDEIYLIFKNTIRSDEDVILYQITDCTFVGAGCAT